jgi:hypothetical protein
MITFLIAIRDRPNGWPPAWASSPLQSFKTIIGERRTRREKLHAANIYYAQAGRRSAHGRADGASTRNAHMERGKIMEDEARDLYALLSDSDPQRVGFIKSGPKGCSPDSLIGERGGLEIKTALPHIQIERLLKGDLPPEHRAQVQGNIWIAEREWWDFTSYWPKLPLFVVRVARDDGYIATLAGAVNQFNEELADLVERLRSYGSLKAQAA